MKINKEQKIGLVTGFAYLIISLILFLSFAASQSKTITGIWAIFSIIFSYLNIFGLWLSTNFDFTGNLPLIMLSNFVLYLLAGFLVAKIIKNTKSKKPNKSRMKKKK